MSTPVIDSLPPELAPEPPPKGPWVWAKDNLFYSTFSSILTILAVLVVVLFFRGILGFVFAEGRGWDSVATNMRLYMTQAYPEDNYARVWASLGLILALSGVSVAIWRVGGRMIVAALIRGFLGAGGFLLFTGFVALGAIPGAVVIGAIVAGTVLLGAGLAAQQSLGDRAKELTVPTLSIAVAALTLVIIGIWTIPIGDYRFIEGEAVEETGRTIAMSTKLPLTIMAIVIVAAYFLGKLVRDRLPGDMGRSALLLGWVLSTPTILLIIMRAPDWGDIEWGRDIVIFLAFAIAGVLLLLVLTNPEIGEPGRLIAGAVLVVAIASWGISMLIMLRLLLLLLAGFALAAPTFAGEMKQRVRYAVTWVLTILPVIFFLALVDTESTLMITGTSFLGGLALTFVLAFVGIVLSFPIGVAMALGRTSTMPIFRVVSTIYIEVVRGIPFITVLIFADLILELFLPEGLSLDDVVQAIAATTFFSAAYLAENVRGGLQAIPKGQYEASKALGMTTFQTTVFIVMPQALRAVVPALVGQTIAIFKDTSLVAIIGLFDLLYIGSKVVPAQTTFLGLLKENLLFVAAVYWIFTFAFSRASVRLEKKLGLGVR